MAGNIWAWGGGAVWMPAHYRLTWKEAFSLLMIFLYLSPPVQNEWAVLLVKIDECSG